MTLFLPLILWIVLDFAENSLIAINFHQKTVLVFFFQNLIHLPAKREFVINLVPAFRLNTITFARSSAKTFK